MGNLCGKAHVPHMITVWCAVGPLGKAFRGGSETLSHRGLIPGYMGKTIL
jgi:hypothetical protein